jgi:hypothetical protein
MTQCLFFCGKSDTETGAVRDALSQCGDLLLNHTSLVVQLVEVVPSGQGVDVHIRVMALADSVADSSGHTKKEKPPTQDLVPDSPDIISGQPDARPLAGQNAAGLSSSMHFDEVAMGGPLPDVATQDMSAAIKLGLTKDQAHDYYKAQDDANRLREQAAAKPDSA